MQKLYYVLRVKFLPLLFLVMSCLSSCTNAEKTPSSLGYTFPDEWEEHRGTMMIFPTKIHYGSQIRGLRREFVEVVKAIAENEPVEVFCLKKDAAQCRRLMRPINNVHIHEGEYSIDWARDNAPMVLRRTDGTLATAGFRCNGWGKKYVGWEEDVNTRENIAKAMRWQIFHSDLVLEGGSIEIGGGVGIVTESCVLNRNRTHWSKDRVEKELKAMLGLKKIIWIKSGLMPDPVTDGHVDGLLKFIAQDTVLLHTTDDQSDSNYQICQDAKQTLLNNGFKVVELPLAEDMVHMNFYTGSNGEVAYVPICGDPTQDEPALKIIRKYFKRVVPILANHIAEAGGGIHCYTQQIPR